jgi:hypothetical protein
MNFFVDKPYKTYLCIITSLSIIIFNYGSVNAIPISDKFDDIIIAEELRLSPKPSEPKPLTEREIIEQDVKDVSVKYNIEPELIMSMIEQESSFDPNCKTGVCVGLMQINPKYHSDRAEQLGVTNLYDIHGNILVGVDYLAELISKHKDKTLALMCYNMDHKTAKRIYSRGEQLIT